MTVHDIERMLIHGKRMGTTKEGCYIAGALDARDKIAEEIEEYLWDSFPKLGDLRHEIINGTKRIIF